MATDNWTSEAFLSDNTEFQTWAQRIHTAITGVGITNTSDTGQVDLTTAARPSAGSYAGYKIYRFSDTLQATKPIFIKIEYGVGSAQDRPAMRVSTGTGTNGAGTLSGQLSGSRVITPGSSRADEDTAANFASGDTNRLALALNLITSGAGTFGMVWVVERSHDEDGTDNGDFCSFASIGTGGAGHQPIPFTGTVPSLVTALPCLIPNRNDTFGTGGDIYLLPVRPSIIKEEPPMRDILVYRHADIAEHSSITVDHYDTPLVFMPVGDTITAVSATGPQGISTSCSVAIRYE